MVSAQLPAAQLRSLVKGNDLTRHLTGCEEVVLFAVTLGAGADRALRRAQMGSVAMAAAMDAAASAMAEGCAAQAHALLRRSARERGLWLTQRFSPGYGDCPLSLQPALLRLLDAPRAIGLTATKDDLLLPRKSVTAIWRAGGSSGDGLSGGLRTLRAARRLPAQTRGEALQWTG